MSLKTTLFPYQRDTVQRAKEFGGRCLMALSPGLGKSIAAITYIIEEKTFPAIVVCPASLKYNWAQEFEKHYGKTVRILSGTKPTQLADKGNPVYVLNYDIVHAWLPTLLKIKPSVIVFDESHYLKNGSARRTKACAALAFQAEHCLLLTGTPMLATPMDLYTSLNMLFKGRIVSKFSFMNHFTQWYKSPRYGIQITGVKNTEELNTFLKARCMVRYKTEDVLPDLPPFIRQTTLLEMSYKQQIEYVKVHDEFVTWLRETYPTRQIPRSEMSAVTTRFGYIKRLVAEWKVPMVLEQIDDFIAGSDGKLIIFGIHRRVLDTIYEKYTKRSSKSSPFIVRLDGSTPTTQRHFAVQAFQNNPNTRLFLGNLIAAGTGLTLNAANQSLFTELDFTPSNHMQAERRNLRIGQEAAYVRWNYLVMRGTVEEQVANLLFTKQQACDCVIDGHNVKGTFDIVSNLLTSHFMEK